MTVFRLVSDSYFIRTVDGKSIVVINFLGDLVNYKIFGGRKDVVGMVGPGEEYNELEVFGVVIRGQTLQQLANDLNNCDCLVNREGYCYLNTRIATKGLQGVLGNEHLRLNDLFVWSKYGVTPTVTTVWNRRDLYNNRTLVNYEELRDKLSRLERSLKQKDEQLTEYKSKVTKLEGEASKHKKNLEEKDKIIKDKNKEIQQLKAELEGKKKELSTSKDSIKEKEKLLGEKDKDLKNCKTELEEKKKELSKNKEKEKLLEEKEKELKDCKTELEANKKQLSECKKTSEEKDKLLEVKKEELGKLGDQVLTKNKRIGALKVNINSLIVSMAALNKLSNQSPADQADSMNKLLEEKDKELKDCKAELEVTTKELSTNKDRLKEKEKLLEEKKKELKDCYKTALEEKNKELLAYKQRSKEKDKTLEEKNKELEDCKKKKSEDEKLTLSGGEEDGCKFFGSRPTIEMMPGL